MTTILRNVDHRIPIRGAAPYSPKWKTKNGDFQVFPPPPNRERGTSAIN